MKRYFGQLFSLCLLTLSLNATAQAGKEAELPNPKKPNAKQWAQYKQPLYASFASKDERYVKQAPPSLFRTIDYWGETAWRGEQLCAQLLLWSGVGVNDVKISISDFETQSGLKLSAQNCKIAPVQYVMSDAWGKETAGCGPRHIRDYDSALVADIVSDARSTTINVAPKTVQPMWFTIKIPEHTQAGKYKGFITISAKGQSPFVFNANVNVLTRQLPPSSEWSFYLDLWQNPAAVARIYKVTPWSKEHFDHLKPIVEQLAAYGQKTVSVPLTEMSYADPMLDDHESLITLTKRANGEWSVDFTKLDLWLSFMNGNKVNKHINLHVNVQPQQNFTYFDQASSKVQILSCKFDSKEFDEVMGATLKALTTHLDEQKLLDQAALLLRDASKDQLRKMSALAEASNSSLQIGHMGAPVANADTTDFASYAIPLVQVKQLKNKSLRPKSTTPVTLYTTCKEAQPNLFLFSNPADAAWICWYIAANKLNGLTHSFNSWNAHPNQDARSTEWAAGFGYLAYPGSASSIRMERLLEGIQDFEKIQILSEEFEKKNNMIGRDKLNQILKMFQLELLSVKSSAATVEEARILLNSL
ncbi:MAG: DUF4091 domain-containing protein [Prevotellaceae bacterium]|jgi:hypothetical protein|nr:DUF4091 domain-containing protein [Prevotellaceae bacterium]